MSRVTRYLPSVALLVVVGVIWELWVDLRRVPDFLAPAPSAIWRALLAERGDLWANTIPTLETAVIGFVVSLALGLSLALAMRYSRVMERALLPVVITSQTIPLIALAPVLVVVLGFGMLPKLIIVALVCFFPITMNAVDGFAGVDPEVIALMRTMGASRLQCFREVEWPSALPAIFSGAKVAVTFCVVGALWGELVGSSAGLGYLINQQENGFDTAGMFASIIVLALMGVMLFVVVAMLERLAVPWHHDDRRSLSWGQK